MAISNSFKMVDNKDLNLTDQVIYALISCYSDGKVSRISRETLARKAGIKKVDTITTHTNRLEELGLIEKEHFYDAGKKLVRYHLTQADKNFM